MEPRLNLNVSNIFATVLWCRLA